MADTAPILEIYKASAGSGKTYQLALKYICLLLGKRIDKKGNIRLYGCGESRRHREILAITFTNKATEEMKQRIISELYLLSRPELKSKYRKHLLKACSTDAVTLADAARRALTSLLFDFGGMQVSTIDAFFQRILRSFAYEADLTGNYDLMVDNKLMIQMALADMLTMVCGLRGSTDYDRRHIARVRRWIGQLLNLKADAAQEIKIFDRNSSVRKELTTFINDLSDETYQTISERLQPFFDSDDAIDNLLSALTAKRSELDSQISALALEATSTPGILNANATKFFARLAEANYGSLTQTNLQYVSGERTSVDGFFLKSAGETAAHIERIERIFNLLRLRFTVNLMCSRMYNLGLFKEVQSVASLLKVHLNTIMLSDTNTLLNKIIAGSPTPFIYERTGQQLHHFLIDEFQDTSKLQWVNLHPLIANSIANGYDNMIIGDVKQCIYRFRNSYPGLLDTELEADGELSHAISLPDMSTNWRSSRHVVGFNSRLFASIAAGLGLSSYAKVGQTPRSDAGNGYINILLTADKTAGFDRMVDHMRRQLASGYKPADIVVLVRFNREAGRIVEQLTAESRPGGRLEGVRIISDEALYVRSSKAVQLIVAKLRELDRIQRDPAEIKVNPRTGLPPTTERELDWLCENLDQINSRSADSEKNLEELLRRFDERNHLAVESVEADAAQRARARGRSVFEIVEELIGRLPDPSLRQTQAQYIAAFQDLVIEYCRMYAPTVHGFLQLWDERLEQTAAVGLAEGTDAIRVLTIHKSKGLEFECVHIPSLSGRMDTEKGHSWYEASAIFDRLELNCATPAYFPLDSASSDMKLTLFAPQLRRRKAEALTDELNALYVAFTRAKSELTVTATDGGGDTSAAALLRRALDSDPETARGETEGEYVCGAPTMCISADKPAGFTPMPITDGYTVFNRLDVWHSTSVATEEDSGNSL